MKRYATSHLIKMEDLNHHRNLYGGRGIEWMIECSFIVVNCEYTDKEGLLYKNTHKFDFLHSAYPGDIVDFEGVIVRTGRSSLTVRVGMYDKKTGKLSAEGFTTFVTIDPKTNRPVAHGIVLDETDDEQELAWRKEAASFFVKKENASQVEKTNQ